MARLWHCHSVSGVMRHNTCWQLLRLTRWVPPLVLVGETPSYATGSRAGRTIITHGWGAEQRERREQVVAADAMTLIVAA